MLEQNRMSEEQFANISMIVLLTGRSEERRVGKEC